MLSSCWFTSTMTVRVRTESEYGEEYADPVTIRNVRFQRASALTLRTVGGEAVGHAAANGPSGKVFVSAEHSVGGFQIPPRSVVSIDGSDEMQVVSCRRCEDWQGVLTHWELEVR